MRKATWQRILIEFVLLIVLSPSVAHAEIFSPGALSFAHREIEGSDNCLKCHAAGSRVSMPRCLDCHKDVKASIDAKKGLHGHIAAADLSCDNCHHEHLGRDNNLLPWEADKSDFDHASTGWALRGGHAKVKCDACHTAKAAKTGHTDYTGLSTSCRSCHFDEHRGQEKGSCDSCHNEQSWKPAPEFDHDGTDYELTGKHRAVPCAKCHPSQTDTQTPPGAKPAPVSMTFAKYVGIAHEACTDCHTDPHKGKFGATCTSCHSTRSWFVINGKGRDRDFHQKTRYPLEGQHVAVPCKSCHGPFGKTPAVYRGIKFGACEDCHVDAHEGQLQKSTKHRAPACQSCHTVQGFLPTLFDVEAHNATDYPLEGAHAVTPCNLCHLQKSSLAQRVPASAREKLRHEGRDLLISTTELVIEKPLQRCDSCHLDVHDGQFDKRVAAAGCADCHQVESFHKVNFDHAKESRFALTGAHASTACSGCHTRVAGSPAGSVIYKPLDTACGSCHRDVHMGQFATNPKEVAPCEQCHTTAAFKPLSQAFNHNDPNDARFALDGAHTQVACDACHAEAIIDKRNSTKRYRPLPQGCEGCHEDYHKGSLDNLPQSPNAQSSADTNSKKAACGHCHNSTAWLPANYPEHATVSFPLRGAHNEAACTGCHLRGFKTAVNATCESCHRDVHAGEFGAHCEACHNEDNWRAEFSVEAHRSTNFPLTGAHGAVPCQECHIGYFSHDFRGTTVECIGCHEGDYLRAGTVSVNHVASGFSVNCRECHDPWAFQRARLADHDACFPISSGAHAGIFCTNCHVTLVGAVDNGKCQVATPNCIGCHDHSQAITDPQHTQVAGYVFNNAGCYNCHMQGK